VHEVSVGAQINTETGRPVVVIECSCGWGEEHDRLMSVEEVYELADGHSSAHPIEDDFLIGIARNTAVAGEMVDVAVYPFREELVSKQNSHPDEPVVWYPVSWLKNPIYYPKRVTDEG
jgi:hypothetical protein